MLHKGWKVKVGQVYLKNEFIIVIVSCLVSLTIDDFSKMFFEAEVIIIVSH